MTVLPQAEAEGNAHISYNSVVLRLLQDCRFTKYVSYLHVSYCQLPRDGTLPSLIITKYSFSGFGGLEVAFWHLVPKFAGLNPAEVVAFFREKKKSSARLPSKGK
jgi:hypothetical protein